MAASDGQGRRELDAVVTPALDLAADRVVVAVPLDIEATVKLVIISALVLAPPGAGLLGYWLGMRHGKAVWIAHGRTLANAKIRPALEAARDLILDDEERINRLELELNNLRAALS